MLAVQIPVKDYAEHLSEDLGDLGVHGLLAEREPDLASKLNLGSNERGGLLGLRGGRRKNVENFKEV